MVASNISPSTHQVRRTDSEEEANLRGLMDSSVQMKSKEAQEMFEIIVF